MTDLDPQFGRSYESDNLDPRGAEKLSGNLLRRHKLNVEEAPQKYGKEMHHKTKLVARSLQPVRLFSRASFVLKQIGFAPVL